MNWDIEQLEIRESTYEGVVVWWWIEILNNIWWRGIDTQRLWFGDELRYWTTPPPRASTAPAVVVWWWIEILNNTHFGYHFTLFVVVWWWIEILNNRLLQSCQRCLLWFGDELRYWTTHVKRRASLSRLWFGDELRYWTTYNGKDIVLTGCGLVMNWDIEQQPIWPAPERPVVVWWWIEILNNETYHGLSRKLVVVWWWIEILNNRTFVVIVIYMVVVWWWIEILNNIWSRTESE